MELRRPWRDLGFLFVTGSFGAFFGAAAAALTSRISAEYFLVAKSVPDDFGFVARVLVLGGWNGFGAFGLAAVVLLLASSPQSAFRRRLGSTLFPAAGAVVGGALLGVTQLLVEPFSGPDVGPMVAPSAEPSFTIVWCTHVGMYAGGAVGMIPAALRLRSRPLPRRTGPRRLVERR